MYTKTWTSKEVSEYLQITEQTVRRLATEGQIPAYRVGKVWRFKADEIKSLTWAEQVGK